MLSNIFDRRYYINTQAQHWSPKQRGSTTPHKIYASTNKPLLRCCSCDHGGRIILAVTLWVVEKLNSVVICRLHQAMLVGWLYNVTARCYVSQVVCGYVKFKILLLLFYFYYCFPPVLSLSFFFKQGNQPNQIKQSQTKVKPDLNIPKLTKPNLT